MRYRVICRDLMFTPYLLLAAPLEKTFAQPSSTGNVDDRIAL